ncbi:MAG TPA: Rieske 2Fe-2S domain-containing protein [Propionibacterium sp.]|nr:Rieske 2Fe-2S domain-containing protein [Propionibacterium sp.]
MFDLDQIIDTENGRISGRLYTDPVLYEAELEEVFGRTWVFLAHDSMLPRTGSYVQNYIGEDPVVVVRQKDGSVVAFLNQCRHRGMRICRADRGTAKSFMCSFHGWAYGLDGALLSVPHREDTYPDSFDPAQLGAVKVPRLANYKGFIFGTWDADAPEFEDYLGDAAWYLDGYIDRWPGGMEAIAVHKWVLPANWKFNVEQPTGDGQHAEISHISAIEALKSGGSSFDRASRRPVPEGRQWQSTYGHGGSWVGAPGREIANASPALVAWEREHADAVAEHMGDTRERRGHANIFPNFMLLGNGTFRVTHPRGTDEMEIWAWTFVPREAPDEVKEAVRLDVLRTFSPSGMFEQDDAENWEEMQRILRGTKARKQGYTYDMRRVPATRDPDYPGVSTAHVYSDNSVLAMYDFYRDLVSGTPWNEISARRTVAATGKEQ